MSTADVQELKEMCQSIQTLSIEHGRRLENVTQLIIGNPLDKDPNKGMMGRINVVEEKQEESETKVMTKVAEVEKKVMSKVLQIDTKVTEIIEQRKKSKHYIAGMVAAGIFFMTVIQVVINYLINK